MPRASVQEVLQRPYRYITSPDASLPAVSFVSG